MAAAYFCWIDGWKLRPTAAVVSTAAVLTTAILSTAVLLLYYSSTVLNCTNGTVERTIGGSGGYSQRNGVSSCHVTTRAAQECDLNCLSACAVTRVRYSPYFEFLHEPLRAGAF